ncbi:MULTISPECIES: aquaporin [Leifsonia]|uniref:Transporter, major intrinsic protein family protein n=2 Tax=Leifsonia aquatica TaxID=144185 RepID=U2RBW3_LEIAQ|nr:MULTISPECIES: MIP/aquaporin family protein [Leifsonia]ERK72740.1 transporter, major intrinsic protein family protein [Leifsonia aquatica ATCC 14665]MBB2967241.1 glycerol uptake facilitator-like aquaporin [Leifsonia aquatica]QIZ97383.1 aquaporin family protein [Leifsonia sp. PS1209]
MNTRLLSRLLAEFLGTGLLVTVVVGSGIAASRLSHDTGLQLLENSIATALGLAVLILLFGPVSGAHFNPVVSLVDWIVGRSARNGLTLAEAGAYILAQVVGAIGGALLANAMFELPTHVATTERVTAGTLIGEVVATAGLIMLILALARSGRSAAAAPAIGAYIGAAYWFTSSTSFANPAVTIGRIFSDSFAGIAPASVLPFIAAQLVGAAIDVGLTLALFRSEKVLAEAAADVVIPQTTDR